VDVEASDLQRNRIGASHIQLSEVRFLQPFWKEFFLPVVEDVWADLVLPTPFFDGKAALTLLFDEILHSSCLSSDAGLGINTLLVLKKEPECHTSSDRKRWVYFPLTFRGCFPFLQDHCKKAIPLLGKIAEVGYFGHVGIDAMLYTLPEDPHTLHLHPVVEINARKTMGWAALAFQRRYFPD
jgi:hypothetical protein